jgi:RND family efflux transporter MFP subunit
MAGRYLAARAALLFAAVHAVPAHAGEIILAPVQVIETKAVFGRIESRFVIPARSRIGGTLVELSVTEGSAVEAGQVVARVVDEKLALQTAAADARIRALRSELENARAEYDRTLALQARGATTQQRIDQTRTQVDVLGNQIAQAEAERAVIAQQASEGSVLAPAAGRILTVPARRGTVMLPGEPVATVAGGGVFLRLAIPERHAADLRTGASVAVGGHDGERRASGRIEKLYPQIENGRVIADVAVEGLPDSFVGERVLVQVPVGAREALLVSATAVETRGGVDRVRIVTPDGPREVAVIAGEATEAASGTRREILSGLKSGDRIIVP